MYKKTTKKDIIKQKLGLDKWKLFVLTRFKKTTYA